MLSHFKHLLPASYSDPSLVIALYAIAAIVAFVALLVGIFPPKTKRVRAATAAMFIILSVFGTFVTKEQAKRTVKAASDASEASKQDAIRRDRTETELLDVKKQNIVISSQNEGIKSTVEAIAKGSPDPRWKELSTGIKNLQAETAAKAAPCQPDGNPYHCKTDPELVQFLVDESNELSLKVQGAFAATQSVRSRPATEPGITINQVNWRFTTEMKSCCLEVTEQLRAEAISRIGPRAHTSEEQSDWDLLHNWLRPSSGLPQTIFPGSVRNYIPHLQEWAKELNAKQANLE